MLARAYLIRSGLGGGGTRNQADLDSAKFYAGDVCKNSGLTLMPNYYDLFTSANFSGSKVPAESLFSLLWVPTGQWFVQNHMQANLAYDSKITQTGDGWGGAFGASPSLMQYYMAATKKIQCAEEQRSLCQAIIIRISTSQMVDGMWIQPCLTLQPICYRQANNCSYNNGTYYGNDHAYVKKYVIGSPADNGGLGGQQNDKPKYLHLASC